MSDYNSSCSLVLVANFFVVVLPIIFCSFAVFLLSRFDCCHLPIITYSLYITRSLCIGSFRGTVHTRSQNWLKAFVIVMTDLSSLSSPVLCWSNPSNKFLKDNSRWNIFLFCSYMLLPQLICREYFSKPRSVFHV